MHKWIGFFMFVLPLKVDMLVSPSDVAVSDLWTYLTKPDLFILFPEFNQVANLNKKKDTIERKGHGSTQNFKYPSIEMPIISAWGRIVSPM